MTGLYALVKRNSKLFFKDKGMFFTSLITPMILLVLYATFLAKVYRDSFMSAMPSGISIDETLINGMVGGQLVSSLLAVSCVTVAVCSNLLMIQDKTSGARRDITMAPVSSSTLAFGYFISSAMVTLMISFVTLAVGLVYLGIIGWYLSLSDVIYMCADVIVLVIFGTALSSVINCNLSTNGQASAVGTVVSSCYGFICGAYMPISNFGTGLQKLLSFLPGTYGTGLIRNHSLNGVFHEMESLGFPAEVIKAIRDSVDCNLYFFDKEVSLIAMYAVVILAIALLLALYVLLIYTNKKKHR